MIAPDEWGRGYASEIAAAAVARAFGVLGVREVYASILSTNQASRRVVEKAALAMDIEIDRGDHVEVIYAVRQ